MATYGEGLIIINKDSLDLDTGLSEREATQGRVFQSFSEKGFIIKKEGDFSFSFEDYYFTENYSSYGENRKTESIFVKGPKFSGIPLNQLFVENKEKASKAVNFLCQAIEFSFENNIDLPNIGPLGIIVGDDKTTENKMLILPPTIFIKALNSRSDTFYSLYSGIFKNDSLKKVDNWRFTLACYAYRICTGINPFNTKDSLERVWDYIDNNFIPPELFVKLKDKDNNPIDTNELFNIINNNLKVLPLESIKKNKRYKYIKPQSKPIPKLPESFDIQELKYIENLEYQKHEKRIKKTRFFRKYNLQIKISIISLFVILIILIVTLVDISKRSTTLGLTPEETISMFYSGVNDLDIDKLTVPLEKKSVAKAYKNFIHNMYVTAHVRESYESEKITYTFEQWLNVEDPINTYFFGISDLVVNLLENGKTEKVYKAEYYIAYNDPGNEVFIEKCVDTLTLSFNKDRWEISNFVTKTEKINLNSIEFFEDIQNVLDSIPYEEKHNQGIIIASQLQKKYPWLPSEEKAKEGYYNFTSTN